MPKLAECEIHNVRYNTETTDSCPQCFAENAKKNGDKVIKARSGYFRSIIAKKEIENENLKEQRQWLMEQVYFLRKSVAFLEIRKRELEDGIKGMEKILGVGIQAVEQLEDSKEFIELTEGKLDETN